MPDRIKILLLLVLMALALVTGMLVREHTREGGAADHDTLPETRPDFSMPDMAGNQRHISEWDGKIVLLNFWATWCPPCRDEVPLLIEAQERHGDAGLQVIGISLDERDKVAAFAEDFGINYPLLVHRTAGIDIAREYGDQIGALPYSVIYDAEGRVLAGHTGELHQEDLDRMLKKALGDAFR